MTAAIDLSRRGLLGGLLLASLAARPVLAQPSFRTNPFQLGVAAGDPVSDGFVIWTRLAPEPLEFGYGMPKRAMEVDWQVSPDAGFAAIARSGKALARPELGHSVHVEVSGLEPGRPYFYRFIVGGERSQTGRAKTAPALAAAVQRLRFGVAGCQNYEAGYFTAYRKLAGEDLDFVYCYGDYIYEGRGSRTRGGPEGIEETPRQHLGDEPYSLDEYRRRYALYKLDTDLQAAHASCAWFPVWDDHETDNNWASKDDQDDTPPEFFLLRRQAAAQAYYENMPLRIGALPVGAQIQIFRRAAYGQLLSLNLLDTRQFRTHQPCVRPNEPCVLDAADGQMMGSVQERWLFDGLSGSQAKWNVIAQQVMMMDLDRDPGPAYRPNTDSWGGYRTPRTRLLETIRDRKVRNPIVLTGDEHINFAGELHVDGRRPGAQPIALEFVGTSITSGGDGADKTQRTDEMLSANPTLKFINNQRGYLVCDVTPDRWTTEFKVLDKVSTRGGALSTRAKWAVEAGNPKLATV